jgi:hypothetical protein
MSSTTSTRATSSRATTTRTASAPKNGARPRPLLIRTYNRLGPLARLDEAWLLDTAVRRTALHDYGDESWRPALGRLLDAIEEEGRPHPFGRWIIQQRLLGLLCNRLRAEHWFARHPEILDQPLHPPVLVTGLQRSGTTLLHRLLAVDPAVCSVLSWEAINPAPTRVAGLGIDPRPAFGWLSERTLRWMSPEFFAIHPVQFDAPEEDVLLLDISFVSQVPEAMLPLPTFSRWVEQQDPRPGYEYLRKLLLLLQWQKGRGSRWVLKSPNHLEWLSTIVAVMPELRIVHTHRDPLVTLPSLLSMIHASMRVFCDHVRPEEVGQLWRRKILLMLARGAALRQSTEAHRLVDVSYYDLVREPLAELGRIRQALGWPASPEVDERMRRYLAQNRQHKHGVHRYALADFGLDPAEVERDFASYRRDHQIRYERRAPEPESTQQPPKTAE